VSGLFISYEPLLDLILINSCIAFSQAFVLRAGIFSLAIAPLASIGAYVAAVLTLRYNVPMWQGLLAATAAGSLTSGILAIPLSRLRGVFQAIATIAFMQIVISLTLYAEEWTGGAMGLNGIPKLASTGTLLVMLMAVAYLYHAVGISGLGRVFQLTREDETVAVALGINVARYHALAFAISGAVAGLGGGLLAYNTYSLSPEQFGFGFLVAALAAVVVGGQRLTFGPILGAALLTVLPELIRPLADQRLILNGLLLMAVMILLPDGIVDTLAEKYRVRRLKLGAQNVV
jgi:branched-chain amino acid transport system permease protein